MPDCDRGVAVLLYTRASKEYDCQLAQHCKTNNNKYVRMSIVNRVIIVYRIVTSDLERTGLSRDNYSLRD